MATKNRTARIAHPTPRTHEGAPAARINTEQQLRRTVMACLLGENTFYESGASIESRIAKGVAGVPLETAAAIAIEAREVMHLRHVPLLVVREMARRGGPIVGDTLARVIQRADEITEFLSIYWATEKPRNGTQQATLPAQVKRGLGLAFRKFDEYQLGKYDRAKEVRLRDALFLAHPKPTTEEQAALWKRLVDNQLAVPNTWEVRLSAAKSAEEKKAIWIDLLETESLGGMAMLRNLRNMDEVGVERALIAGHVARNPFKRVLPFRFISAAKHAPWAEAALEQAMFRALEGAERLAGKTALVVDHSGSMDAVLSERSEMTRFGAAAALGMYLREICDDVVIVVFGDTAAEVPARRGFALADAMHSRNVGHSTHAEAGHQLANKLGADRVIVISDMQTHDMLGAPRGTGYTVNVAPYKNGVGYGRWTNVDGFSEGIVKYILAAEKLG